MYYEIYADSLFVLHLGMNTCLLILINRSLLGLSTRRRLILGALSGSVPVFLLLCLGAVRAVTLVLMGVCGSVGMLFVAFPIRSLYMLWKLFQKLLFFSFCMGGTFLFLIRVLHLIGAPDVGIPGMLVLCALICFGLCCALPGSIPKESLCAVILREGEHCVRTTGLIDSGNSLLEPISGKPVSIVTKEVFALLGKEESGVWAIPYHSVGKRAGILMGYRISELELEVQGVRRRFENVLIAVEEEGILSSHGTEETSVKMIVNPMLFVEGSRGRFDGRM